MILVKERGVRLKGLVEESTHMRVGRLVADQAVSPQDALGVSVHDKRRSMAGVEENGVGRLRPDAVDAQQTLPGGPELPVEHLFQRAGVVLPEAVHEGLEP